MTLDLDAIKALTAKLHMIHEWRIGNEAADTIDALVAEVERLRAMFRVNMLRYGPPGIDHAAIDSLLQGQERARAALKGTDHD